MHEVIKLSCANMMSLLKLLLFTVDKPQITSLSVIERCVSYLYITWDDTTQCVPVNYTVMLTNTSSGELLLTDTTSANYYNFTGLTSDTLYTVTITGRNRVGQHVVINQTSSLKSNGKTLIFSHIQYFPVNTHGYYYLRSKNHCW